jgi:dipeptidyl aminopeptidase/acylaminoacyl peptidase
VITEAPDLPWRLLYVVDGNLWETDGTTAVQVTEAGSMWQPAFGDSGIAFVQRSRNASDIWLATGDTAARPLTHDASSSASLSHWATQPVFVPGKQSMYVLGDFNKSNTGVGDLAVWELNLQGEIIGQVTRPPAYAGGDQDVTVNPTDPRQLIFTRYSYAGTQLSEQLQWLNVTSGGSAVPLTRDNQASRQASYSPDGTQIAFVQAGPGQEEDLYVARVDVSGNQPELTNVQEVARGVIANPTWTPDGTGLAYVALTGAQFQVWALDIRTDSHGTLTISQPRQMTHGPEVDASSRPLLLTVGQANQLKDWLAQSGS